MDLTFDPMTKPCVVNWIWQIMAACSCNASIQAAKINKSCHLYVSMYQFSELIILEIWKVPMKWIGSTFSKLYCYDSNDLLHSFLTLTCPSVYHNYASELQYVNISQFIRCNILIQQNTISFAALIPAFEANSTVVVLHFAHSWDVKSCPIGYSIIS